MQACLAIGVRAVFNPERRARRMSGLQPVAVRGEVKWPALN